MCTGLTGHGNAKGRPLFDASLHFRLAFDNIEHVKVGGDVQVQNVIEWLNAPSLSDLLEFISVSMRQTIHQTTAKKKVKKPRFAHILLISLS